jgi:hypothetical protein
MVERATGRKTLFAYIMQECPACRFSIANFFPVPNWHSPNFAFSNLNRSFMDSLRDLCALRYPMTSVPHANQRQQTKD